MERGKLYSLIAISSALLLATALWLYFVTRSVPETENHVAFDATIGEEVAKTPAELVIDRDLSPVLQTSDVPQVALPAAIHGRCVDVAGQPTIRAHIAIVQSGSTQLLKQARSDARGEFLIELPAHESEDLVIIASAKGFQNQAHPLLAWCAAHANAIPTLIFERGILVHGRIVEPAGLPVAGAQITCRGAAFAQSVSDAKGYFAFDAAMPAGEARFSIEADGYYPRAWQRKFPEEEPAPVHVLHPRRPTRGFVRAPDGSGIGGVVIRSVSHPAAASLPSAADGAFEIWEPPDDADAVLLVIDLGLTSPWKSAEVVRWGTQDLEITVLRTSSMHLRVIGAEDRKPVEQYFLRFLGEDQEERGDHAKSVGGHPDGKVTIPHLELGLFRFRVIPTNPRYAPSELISIHIHAEGSECEVLLPARARAVLNVQDETGSPLEGAHAEVLVVANDERPDRWKRSHRDSSGLSRVSKGEQCVLADGRSNAVGEVELWLAEGRHGDALRVQCKGYAPGWIEAEIHAGAAYQVQLERAANLQVELVPPTLESLRGFAWITPLSGAYRVEELMTSLMPRHALKSSWNFKDLAPGPWQLHVQIGAELLVPEAGRITLAAGEKRHLTLDCGWLQLATLIVELDPALLKSGTTFRVRATLESTPFYDRYFALEDPSLRTGIPLTPAEYEFHLYFDHGQTLPSNGKCSLAFLFLGERHLAAGELVHLRPEILNRNLSIEFLNVPQDRPFATTSIQLREGELLGNASPNAKNRVIFFPAPTRPFHILVDRARYPAEGEFLPPAGTSDWELSITLR